MNYYYGRCLCYEGYELDADVGCVYIGDRAPYSEFDFSYCVSQYEDHGVKLVGQSYSATVLYPLPVDNRGVFFNNKTYFRVDGLVLGSNFAMNAWIKSHDTGYSTIFGVNGNCLNRGSSTSEFSWRLANSKVTNGKRHNMLEITDWSNEESKVILQAFDSNYRPLLWSNVAYSVEHDWDSELSTITIYSKEHNCFHVRAQISSGRKFTRASISNEYVIGNRLGRNGEPVNSFLGFMYYFAVYTYTETEFIRSIEHRFEASMCWFNEYDINGECCKCDSSLCETCYLDPFLCYCDNRNRRS